MMTTFLRCLQLSASACLLLSLATASHAGNWSNWRGPHGNGVADGSGYPAQWDNTTNILWKAELEGFGGSTPAIWEDRIFVTSPNSAGDNEVVCFDLSGKELWKAQLGKQRAGKHKKASGSNPSPVTDGTHVFCYFKSGDVACLDFSGKIVWQHNLQQKYGEDTLWWDLGTSPVLTDSALVVAVIQSGPSYLVAFEKKTGAVAWKQDRILDAPEEAAQTYATPIVFGSGANQKIAVLGADHVTGHNAITGKELWRIGGLNPGQHKFFRSISSPVLSEAGIIVAPYARGKSLTAIKTGGSGDLRETHLAWETDGPSSDVPTPAAYDGKIYILGDKGSIAAVDAQTGKTTHSKKLPKNRNAYSASPIVADGKLYLTREDATTFVLDASTLDVLAENSIDDRAVATPVLLDGKIYLRAASALYCIGN